MSKKVLSVIVPSYNMEKYLPKCLGSLVVAPELMGRLEVLVVNDGSKDRTSEIAHEFAAKWPETFKVIDKKNGNYGSCINAALPIATGKYVKVLDADDSFETGAFQKYLRYLEGVATTDLVITDYDTVDEKGIVTKRHTYEFRPDQEISVDEFNRSKSYLPMHAYTYRTAILREIGYRQCEGVSYSDTEWITVPLCGVQAVKYVPLTVYRYLFGREGQTMASGVRSRNLWMYGRIVLHELAQYEQIALKGVGREGLQICLQRTRRLLLQIYRDSILSMGGFAQSVNLEEVDQEIKKISPKTYDWLSDDRFSRRLPIRLIAAWRQGGIHSRLLIFVCRCYARLTIKRR